MRGFIGLLALLPCVVLAQITVRPAVDNPDDYFPIVATAGSATILCDSAENVLVKKAAGFLADDVEKVTKKLFFELPLFVFVVVFIQHKMADGQGFVQYFLSNTCKQRAIGSQIKRPWRSSQLTEGGSLHMQYGLLCNVALFHIPVAKVDLFDGPASCGGS